MALNFDTPIGTFTRTVQIRIPNDKGTFTNAPMKCSFVRLSKDDARAFDERVRAASTAEDTDAVLLDILPEFWKGWDVTSNEGPMPFDSEHWMRFENKFPGSLLSVYAEWTSALLGRDRKNA